MRGRSSATTILLSATTLLLVAGTLSAAPLHQSGYQTATASEAGLAPDEWTARAFLEAINELRLERESAPLSWSDSLANAARLLLDKALVEPTAAGFDSAASLSRADLRSSGYEPSRWAEALGSSTREPADFVSTWRQANPRSLGNFLDPGLRDFGLATEALPNQSIYALVAATSLAEINRSIVDQLTDLETVRQQLLGRVNEERERRRRGPLRLSRALNSTAQIYADRMTREGFYGHVSPRGDSVLDRVQASGYDAELTGENLASGQPTAAQAMDNWMASKGHRDNILEHRFQDVGFGVSVVESDGELTVLWVQCFGRRRP